MRNWSVGKWSAYLCMYVHNLYYQQLILIVIVNILCGFGVLVLGGLEDKGEGMAFSLAMRYIPLQK